MGRGKSYVIMKHVISQVMSLNELFELMLLLRTNEIFIHVNGFRPFLDLRQSVNSFYLRGLHDTFRLNSCYIYSMI